MFFSLSDFFNWNKVKIRYCDGASFAGHPENELKVNLIILIGKVSCNEFEFHHLQYEKMFLLLFYLFVLPHTSCRRIIQQDSSSEASLYGKH